MGRDIAHRTIRQAHDRPAEAVVTQAVATIRGEVAFETIRLAHAIGANPVVTGAAATLGREVAL